MQTIHSNEYIQILDHIKKQVRESRQKAFLSANTQLLTLYWNIGRVVSEQAKKANWGARVIEKLAQDLRNEFPDMNGLSFRNIKYMRQFAEIYTDFQIGQQPVAQIPWGHHILLINKIKDRETALFYITKTIENGWSRNVLSLQIKSNAPQRFGKDPAK